MPIFIANLRLNEAVLYLSFNGYIDGDFGEQLLWSERSLAEKRFVLLIHLINVDYGFEGLTNALRYAKQSFLLDRLRDAIDEISSETEQPVAEALIDSPVIEESPDEDGENDLTEPEQRIRILKTKFQLTCCPVEAHNLIWEFCNETKRPSTIIWHDFMLQVVYFIKEFQWLIIHVVASFSMLLQRYSLAQKTVLNGWFPSLIAYAILCLGLLVRQCLHGKHCLRRRLIENSYVIPVGSLSIAIALLSNATLCKTVDIIIHIWYAYAVQLAICSSISMGLFSFCNKKMFQCKKQLSELVNCTLLYPALYFLWYWYWYWLTNIAFAASSSSSLQQHAENGTLINESELVNAETAATNIIIPLPYDIILGTSYIFAIVFSSAVRVRPVDLKSRVVRFESCDPVKSLVKYVPKPILNFIISALSFGILTFVTELSKSQSEEKSTFRFVRYFQKAIYEQYWNFTVVLVIFHLPNVINALRNAACWRKQYGSLYASYIVLYLTIVIYVKRWAGSCLTTSKSEKLFDSFAAILLMFYCSNALCEVIYAVQQRTYPNPVICSCIDCIQFDLSITIESHEEEHDEEYEEDEEEEDEDEEDEEEVDEDEEDEEELDEDEEDEEVGEEEEDNEEEDDEDEDENSVLSKYSHCLIVFPQQPIAWANALIGTFP